MNAIRNRTVACGMRTGRGMTLQRARVACSTVPGAASSGAENPNAASAGVSIILESSAPEFRGIPRQFGASIEFPPGAASSGAENPNAASAGVSIILAEPYLDPPWSRITLLSKPLSLVELGGTAS
jgi:hypothetical protein